MRKSSDVFVTPLSRSSSGMDSLASLLTPRPERCSSEIPPAGPSPLRGLRWPMSSSATAAFLETARKLGVYYYDHYVSRGMLNGGPGDACQAPDSESAFGMLESYVQLYETTGEERWLACAEETFQQAVTWVMSYDFAFPASRSRQRGGSIRWEPFLPMPRINTPRRASVRFRATAF